MAKKYKVADMIEALERASGMVTVACKDIGCSRVTFYKYLKEHPTLQAAKHRINERELDEAENLLKDFITGRVKGQTTSEQLRALQFYLKTKGKSRGYADTLDVKVSQEVQKELETMLDKLQGVLPEELYAEAVYVLAGNSRSAAA